MLMLGLSSGHTVTYCRNPVRCLFCKCSVQSASQRFPLAHCLHRQERAPRITRLSLGNEGVLEGSPTLVGFVTAVQRPVEKMAKSQ